MGPGCPAILATDCSTLPDNSTCNCCAALETILEPGRSALSDSCCCSIFDASTTFKLSSSISSRNGLRSFLMHCCTPQGLKKRWIASCRGFGFLLSSSTTSLMRITSAEELNTTSLFFNHRCTSVIERNALTGCAALLEVSCDFSIQR